MTKDVLISIAGLRYEAEEKEIVEVINRGEYYCKNGKHYIIYDEISEDSPKDVTKCTVKISKDRIELIKNGYNHVHMNFELKRNNYSCYSTPFGDLMMGITTTSIDLLESDKQILANLQYELAINYEHASNYDLRIEVSETQNNISG